MKFEIYSSNPVVKAIIEGTAPRPAQIAASRGILPLPEHDLLEVLVAFAVSDDTELAGHASVTLRAQDEGTLAASAGSPEAAVSVLNYLASAEDLPQRVHESVLTNANTPIATIIRFAKKSENGELLELLASNQQLLIHTPALIDALIANPAGSAEAQRRASETKREFFEKERGVQQIASELRAQGKDAAAEFIEQAEFAQADADSGLSLEDAAFLASMIEVPDSETDDSWLGLEYLEEIYEETEADRQAIANKIFGEMKLEDHDMPNERVSVINRIMKMGMKDRVKLALKGDRESRNILIRDPNRIVAAAVVANPRITEQEVEKIASMRTVTEDILRQLASSRQWSRNYQIVHALAKNPRTPIANVLNILSRLQLRDLAALSKNRNVSDAVRRQAMRLSQARTGQ
jgi:uncharacterized protein YpiB (UPF0302 family)